MCIYIYIYLHIYIYKDVHDITVVEISACFVRYPTCVHLPHSTFFVAQVMCVGFVFVSE